MRDGWLTRRELLTAGMVAGVGSLAGCSGALSLSDSPPKLGRVRVENRDDAPHTVHLLVERDGELVYWQSFDLEATSENEQGQKVRDIRTVPRSEWGDTPGDYYVQARLDHETEVTTDPVNHGAPCELLNVIVHGETESAELSIINGPAEEDCD